MAHTVKSLMGAHLVSRKLARFAPFAALLTLVACSGVLGIEDLNSGPRPGSGGSSSGGETSSAGSNVGPNGGTSPSGGSAGKSQAGDANGGSIGIGQGGEAGTSEGGAGPSGGTSGAAGSGGSGGAVGGTPVSGHVIDFFGHKLSGVPVEIGGTKVVTDEAGAFTIPSVPAQYDASLVVQFPDTSGGQIYGWVYQGLTRRDPTLQVYDGLQSQYGMVDITTTHADQTLTGTRTMSLAFGGPDGNWEIADASGNGYDGHDVGWSGPVTTQDNAYGLIWQPDSNGLPTGYFAYDTQILALDGATTNHSPLTLDMSAKTITSGNITGTVTPGGGQERNNSVFLQFTSNAVLTLVSDNGPNTFAYLVPTIANSSVIFCAAEGLSFSARGGPYALVHRDGLAAGSTGITAAIPKPATLLTVTPAGDKSKVSSTTQFSFQPGTGSTGLYVVKFQNTTDGLVKTDGLYIVTTKQQFTLPEVVNDSFALIGGDSYVWRIETHGALANADVAAGPTGFLDEFSEDFDKVTPSGPRRGNGSYTISDYSDAVTIAP